MNTAEIPHQNSENPAESLFPSEDINFINGQDVEDFRNQRDEADSIIGSLNGTFNAIGQRMDPKDRDVKLSEIADGIESLEARSDVMPLVEIKHEAAILTEAMSQFLAESAETIDLDGDPDFTLADDDE